MLIDTLCWFLAIKAFYADDTEYSYKGIVPTNTSHAYIKIIILNRNAILIDSVQWGKANIQI